MSPFRIGRTVREVALTAGAILGVISLLVGVAGFALGIRPLIFRSGSMSPTIETGALALAHPVRAADLTIGDVVSVTTGTGDRVTHRIVDLTLSGQVATLELRGDANEASDQELYRVAQADRIFFSVPFVGYAVGWLTGPIGLFLLGLYAAFLLSVLVKGNTGEGGSGHAAGPPAPRRRTSSDDRQSRGGRQLTTVIATFAVALGVSLVSAPAWATWSDSVPISGTRLDTVTPTAPVVACGALQLGSVTINWTPVLSATGYRLNFGSGGTSSVDVGPGVLSRTFSGTSGTFSVRALFGPVSWISASSNSQNYSSLLGVLGTCT